MFIVPAYKQNNQVCRGRAKGGLATLWDPSLTKYVSRIKCDNFRLQATKFNFPSGPLLVINSYFPCDPRREDFDDSELMKLLTDIQLLIEISDCEDVLLAGDLNCHFAPNTSFTNIVRTYFQYLNLSILWESENENIQPIDFTHLFTTDNILAKSTIDHFVVSNNVLRATEEAGVIHNALNTSNHSPIFSKIDVGQLHACTEESQLRRRTSWAKASEEAKATFIETLDRLCLLYLFLMDSFWLK